MEYGLIGERLGHSYSPMIHARLADYRYELIEVAPDALDGFLRARDFRGLNVTIPYKRAVIPYCAELSDVAREVGCVNTLLVRPDGSLYGHNTDIGGFIHMLRGAGIDPRAAQHVDEAADVGVVAVERAVRADEQRVHAADLARDVRELRAIGDHGALVRDRDVQPPEVPRAEEAIQRVRRDLDQLVAVVRQPRVDHRGIAVAEPFADQTVLHLTAPHTRRGTRTARCAAPARTAA